MLAIGVAIAATIATSGAGAATRPANCLPPHARTLAKDREVRVYSLARKLPIPEDMYACLLGRGTTVALGKPRRYQPASIDHIALAGAIVAYTEATHGVDTASTDIVVLDVTKRHILLTIPRAGGFVDACVISFREVTDLVVTRLGSVVWIVRKGTRCRTSTFQVYSAQVSATTPALLEEGPAIGAMSLRLANQTVSWVNGRARRSARLP